MSTVFYCETEVVRQRHLHEQLTQAELSYWKNMAERMNIGLSMTIDHLKAGSVVRLHESGSPYKEVRCVNLEKYNAVRVALNRLVKVIEEHPDGDWRDAVNHAKEVLQAHKEAR